jgi:hypothetical protein
VYLVALGAVGNNFLDARSANNQGRSFLPVDHGLNVSVPIATCVGWVASGKRSALGPPIVLGCCALHPLLYLFLEDPVSDFIIKRREIGVELPATRKYFCPKMREPNLIFGSFKNPSRDAVKRCCGTEATAVFDLRVFLSREPETHVFDSLASFLPCAHCVCTRMRDLTAYTCKHCKS